MNTQSEHPALKGLKPLKYPMPPKQQTEHLLGQLEGMIELVSLANEYPKQNEDAIIWGLDILKDLIAEARRAWELEFQHTSGVWRELKHRLNEEGKPCK